MIVEPTHATSKVMVPRTPAINYRLKSKIFITLRCQLQGVLYVQPITQHYKSRSTSAIEVANCNVKNMDDFCYEGKPSHAIAKSTPFAVSKDEWDIKEDTSTVGNIKNLYIFFFYDHKTIIILSAFYLKKIITSSFLLQIIILVGSLIVY